MGKKIHLLTRIKMYAAYPRVTSWSPAFSLHFCNPGATSSFGKLNTFISESRLVMGLREHPNTEQHETNFNLDFLIAGLNK